MQSGRWSEEQTKLAFHLYCQLPFGKLDQRNSEVKALAQLIGRAPSAVAMKLVNFASLDPAIINSGRRGLSNASELDRKIWDAFNADWEGMALECQRLREQLAMDAPDRDLTPETESIEGELLDYTGKTKTAIVEQRIKQAFFRRAVLSSYRGRCCMSDVDQPRLLMASHIVPWSDDAQNRLNPRNGLCLSALHDRAFDRGLIALTDDLKVLVSSQLRQSKSSFVESVLWPLEGRSIQLPERFVPDVEFVRRHRQTRFVDKQSA